MKTKNGTKLAIGLLVCGLFLTACGGNNKSADGGKESKIELTEKGFPIVKDEVTMKMMGPSTGLAEWKDMAFFKDYAKKTGINFKFTTPPTSDFSTKLNLALASGDLPDVIFATSSNDLTPSMEMDYGSQGILVAIEDKIEKNMPNLTKAMEEDPSIRKSITTPDGHIYSLPMISRGDTAIWPRGPMWYRGDWLKALGVTELPKTTDEFYALMKRFKEEDPNGNGKADEVPLTDVKMESTRPWLMAGFGMRTLGIQEDDGKVTYTPISENYKAYLEFMNKLYSEKLLDQEVYGQSDEQRKAKGQNNQVGVFPDWFSYFTTGKDEKTALDDPMFQPLSSKWSKETVVPGSPRMVRETMTITKTCPSPDAILRWADYFYSKEGADYLSNGPEGSLWEWKENDKGEKVRVYAEGIDLTNTEDERGKITPNYGLTVPTLGYPLETKDIIKKDANEEPYTTFNDFIASETENKITKYAKVPFPLLYLTNEETEQVRDIKTDLETYVEQMEAKFITGVEPIENWDKYVKTIESMGVKKYVKTYQSAYDRWEKSE